MTACARKACPHAGTRQPVLLAMPRDLPEYAGPPVELILGILVCDEHQATTQAADLVTDEGWEQIVAAFAAVNRARPDRSTLGLAWKLPAFVDPEIRA